MGGEPYTWRRVSTVRRQAVGNLPPKGGTAPTAEPTKYALKEITLITASPSHIFALSNMSVRVCVFDNITFR